MKKLATISLFIGCLLAVFVGPEANAIGTWPTPEKPVAVRQTVLPQSTVAIDTVPLPESPRRYLGVGDYFWFLYQGMTILTL